MVLEARATLLDPFDFFYTKKTTKKETYMANLAVNKTTIQYKFTSGNLWTTDVAFYN